MVTVYTHHWGGYCDLYNRNQRMDPRCYINIRGASMCSTFTKTDKTMNIRKQPFTD